MIIISVRDAMTSSVNKMAKEKENETEVISESEGETTPKKWKEMTTHEKWRQVGKFSFESFIWLFLLMFIIDIVTKTLIRDNFVYSEHSEVTLINNFLYVVYTVNNGMAWGISTDNATVNTVLFVSISVIGAVIIILVMALRYKRIPKFARACCMLMLAGCIGNLIDRAFYSADLLGASHGGVVDWISFHFGNYEFPTFNWADACLVVGAIMLIIWLFVWDYQITKKEKREKETTSQSQEALKQSQMDAIMHGESVETTEEATKEEDEPPKEEKVEETPPDETGNKD